MCSFLFFFISKAEILTLPHSGCNKSVNLFMLYCRVLFVVFYYYAMYVTQDKFIKFYSITLRYCKDISYLLLYRKNTKVLLYKGKV